MITPLTPLQKGLFYSAQKPQNLMLFLVRLPGHCSFRLSTACKITFVIVRSNTRKVHSSVTPSPAQQLNHRLCPHEGI